MLRRVEGGGGGGGESLPTGASLVSCFIWRFSEVWLGVGEGVRQQSQRV